MFTTPFETVKLETVDTLKDPGIIQPWSPVGKVALFCCLLAVLLIATLVFRKLILCTNFIKNTICTYA